MQVKSGIIVEVTNTYYDAFDMVTQTITVSCDDEEYIFLYKIFDNSNLFYVEGDQVFVMIVDNKIRGIRLK